MRRRALLLVCLLAAPPTVAAAEEPAFSRVLSILADNCFACHGPDEGARQAKLRLDERDEAIRKRPGGAALVPGDAEASALYRRITARDPDERMPPPESKKTLGADEIEVLRRWIDSGATYSRHWAFVAPVAPPIPSPRDAGWSRNPIDRFVLSRMERQGFSPAPAADRHTLARRLYLDLLGVPPTPGEADAFVRDSRPGAYERLVDRLLGSPHYGERWARRWLDLARYSDTNGYEKDRPRSIWPYRDWVIRALNRDLSFDRFTIEQIAGDMLPEASLDQRIATGFHRNTMINEEGGIDPQEFRFYALVDRVATTGATWLGLTLGCARCHNHKYDPIRQSDYYAFLAFFNNADEVEIEVPKDELRRQRTAIRSEIARRVAGLAGRFPLPPDGVDSGLAEGERRARHLRRRFIAWAEEARSRAVRWTVLRPLEVKTDLPTTTELDDGSILVSGDQTKNDVFTLTIRPPAGNITALRLEALPHPSLPAGGPGRRVVAQGPSAGVGDFFLSEIRADILTPGEAAPRPLSWGAASQSFASPEREASRAIDGRGDTGWSVSGRSGEAHVAVFRFRDAVAFDGRSRLRVTLEHESFYPSGLGRFRLSSTTGTGELRASNLPDDVERTLLVPAERRTPQQADRLLAYYLSIAPELAPAQSEITGLRKELPAIPTTLVFRERPAGLRRTTHRHHRGEFLKPREVVEPGVPLALHPLPASAPRNRLSLARWLVDPANPLTARVVVNRHWGAFFGRGLVRSTEDFGVQGALPSHPELLDWLAIEFVRRGWSVKSLHRLIVTSATYRQASAVPPELRARDPENRWLARGPRIRLDAETVRDSVLATSGLLSRRIGGPSVFPSQPPGITEAAYGPLKWTTSEGEARYRRGLYTFNKRTAPYAVFSLFDAPSGEACVPRRSRSNTPLQALAMLNDEVVVDAARAMARRLTAVSSAAGAAERATDLFRRCVGRPPEPGELRAILDFFENWLVELDARSSPASEILGEGEGASPSPSRSRAEAAAWTLTARSLLNLDEVITRP